MERDPVVSSVISEIGYNASSRTLEILFKSGAIYLYYFVPQDVYDALMTADAKGVHFKKHIKTSYEYHRIAEPWPTKTDEQGQLICPHCGKPIPAAAPRQKIREPYGQQRPALD
jgi:KTSC domain